MILNLTAKEGGIYVDADGQIRTGVRQSVALVGTVHMARSWRGRVFYRVELGSPWPGSPPPWIFFAVDNHKAEWRYEGWPFSRWHRHAIIWHEPYRYFLVRQCA